MPSMRRTMNSAAATTAPVLPAETTPATRPSRSRFMATTSEESRCRRQAVEGLCSSIGMTEAAGSMGSCSPVVSCFASSRCNVVGPAHQHDLHPELARRLHRPGHRLRRGVVAAHRIQG